MESVADKTDVNLEKSAESKCDGFEGGVSSEIP